jgi:hypothetical protein
MRHLLLAGFPGLHVQPRNLLPAGVKITSYNHHHKAPSFFLSFFLSFPVLLGPQPQEEVLSLNGAFALIQSTFCGVQRVGARVRIFTSFKKQGRLAAAFEFPDDCRLMAKT